MTIYILGENTVEQTMVNGKPDFTKPIQDALALNGYRIVLDDQDKYDHKWIGVYKDED